jgi:predicted DNA-binding protein (MmcQ/YjbR family)
LTVPDAHTPHGARRSDGIETTRSACCIRDDSTVRQAVIALGANPDIIHLIVARVKFALTQAGAGAGSVVPLRREAGGVEIPASFTHSPLRRVDHRNMTYEKFNAFCRTLPATTYVMQWGGSHVWKVGGKVFAIGSGTERQPGFTFKVSDVAYEMLQEQPGLRPAPYLASRGMKWIQHFAKPGLSDAALRDYLRQSHAIVAQGLSKKRRVELGLATP